MSVVLEALRSGSPGERTRGAFRLLAAAWMYDAIQDALGARQLRARFAREHLRLVPAARVLDVGCGTGALRRHLGACEYAGVDASAAYLEMAASRAPGARLTQADVARPESLPDGPFDVVVMSGLLHHLPDRAARDLVRAIPTRLAPGGRLVTLDPTIDAGSHPVGRCVAACDRGRHVRSPAGYRRLVVDAFGRVELVVRHDLLRIPYSHAILTCERGP